MFISGICRPTLGLSPIVGRLAFFVGPRNTFYIVVNCVG